METELRRPEVPEKLRFEACDVSKETIRALLWPLRRRCRSLISTVEHNAVTIPITNPEGNSGTTAGGPDLDRGITDSTCSRVSMNLLCHPPGSRRHQSPTCQVPLFPGVVGMFSAVTVKFVALYPIGVLFDDTIDPEGMSTRSTLTE